MDYLSWSVNGRATPNSVRVIPLDLLNLPRVPVATQQASKSSCMQMRVDFYSNGLRLIYFLCCVHNRLSFRGWIAHVLFSKKFWRKSMRLKFLNLCTFDLGSIFYWMRNDYLLLIDFTRIFFSLYQMLNFILVLSSLQSYDWFLCNARYEMYSITEWFLIFFSSFC